MVTENVLGLMVLSAKKAWDLSASKGRDSVGVNADIVYL